MENNESCCIAKILKVIDVLQKETNFGSLEEGCSRPVLGALQSSSFNTRPITLYTRNGTLFTVNYYVNNVLTTSSVFRVENVNGCCATLRILAPAGDTYTSTNEFVTINTECFCVLSCLTDISLEI